LNIFTYRPLTELEFLSKQDLINEIGFRTSNGVLLSRVTPSGKTFVLVKAKCSVGLLSTGDGDFQVQLRIDGTVIDECQYDVATNGVWGALQYEFIPKGQTMIGDGVISIDLNVANLSSGVGRVRGSLFGYEKTT